ncbi:divergent PAP2 family protein [Catenovulum sp. SM1970]|uniref:divergent PAP2 family protein n=1 Tax=Marinifaba aquimaris TaxID=2741323 RepID=UPI0015736909|nr:divergent PAP2 family protein [Marinifaba aquimaris]NTS75942.1 divergent PAP2 family protein [Marinifaba aquimaris]
MDLAYLITPFIAWLIAGCSKFAINCIREKRLAFDLIGYGGLPSNHSAIVTSAAALVALREGIGHPAFGVAVALCYIVMLDANSLRIKVGLQAQRINELTKGSEHKPLRERMGHTKVEIFAGAIVGVITAYLVFLVNPTL